jgi:hypothetical protein
VEKDVLIELIDSKLHLIREDMKKILQNWEYISVDKFIQDARDGTLLEAEDDAVCMRGLIYDQEKMLQLKRNCLIITNP